MYDLGRGNSVVRQGRINAELIATYLQLKRVAVIYTTDNFAVSGRNAFITEAELLGLRVIVQLSFEFGKGKEIVDAEFLKLLVRSGVRAVFISMTSSDARAVMTVAKEVGLLRPGYIWLSHHGVTGPQFYTGKDNTIDDTLLDLAQGMLGTNPGVIDDSPEWTSFITAYRSFQDPLLPKPSETPEVWCAYAYDAAHLFARASSAMIAAGGDPQTDRAGLLQFVRRTKFSGLTGTVALDTFTGERLDEFNDVLSVKGRTAIKVGRVGPDGTLVIRGEPYFRDSVQPADRPASRTNAFMAVVFIYHGSSIIVKRSSAFFCQIMIIGSSLIYVVPFLSIVSLNKVTCNLEPWLFNIGWGLALSSSFAKLWRLYRIFSDSTKSTRPTLISLRYLFGFISSVFIIQAVISASFLIDPLDATLSVDAYGSHSYCGRMSDGADAFSHPLQIVSLAINGSMLLINAWIATKTRKIWSEYRETQLIFFMCYVNLLNYALYIVSFVYIENGNVVFAFRFLSCFFIGASIWILFGPRVWMLMRGKGVGGSEGDVSGSGGQNKSGSGGGMVTSIGGLMSTGTGNIAGGTLTAPWASTNAISPTIRTSSAK
ncbi:hypothetical protein HK102_005611 [Quaeritorhiza haematococci]|nr:hypothetical protein HK102_005611 [Quaeritorhiza haematococci]